MKNQKEMKSAPKPHAPDAPKEPSAPRSRYFNSRTLMAVSIILVLLVPTAAHALSSFYFSFSLSLNSGGALPGSKLTTTVVITLTSGTPTLVSLSASDLPQCTTVSFSPQTGTPSFQSQMTLSIGSCSPPGAYAVTVTGTSSSYSNYAEYVLTVQNPPTCNSPTIQLGPPTVSGLTLQSINGITQPGSSSCAISSISWALGDGTQLNSWFPMGPHTYASTGTHVVTATTHQTDGKVASASEMVTVAPAVGCSGPNIQLGTPSISGQTLQSINGITLPGGNSCYIQSVTWSFGDSTAQVTSWFPAGPHAYLNGGTYTITATAHQSDGKTASASTTFTIQTSSPPAGATYSGVFCYEDGSCYATAYYANGVWYLGPVQVSSPSEPCTSQPYSGGTGILDYIWNYLLGIAALLGGLLTKACSITT
jgi:hypothetical protein